MNILTDPNRNIAVVLEYSNDNELISQCRNLRITSYRFRIFEIVKPIVFCFKKLNSIASHGSDCVKQSRLINQYEYDRPSSSNTAILIR